MSNVNKPFIDEKIPDGIDIREDILKLKKEKNAIILAHYYQSEDIQDIADFRGDSLALAQVAAKTDADIIVMCGVHFMGETAKALSPNKRVIIPDLNAGCSLAESCKVEDFKKFLNSYPNHKVVTYVNTSADIKVYTDIVVTSTNAKEIVDSFPKDEKIIFGPDRNLGNYINSVTGRDMVLWDGACHVHEQFSLEKILKLKEENPDALILAHPECKKTILLVADKVGSTQALLNFAVESECKKFIVVTESGIIHQMKQMCKDKKFIPAPPEDSTCACNECNFMRLNTMEKLYNALKFEYPVIELEKDIIEKSVKPIERMIELSEKLGLIKK